MAKTFNQIYQEALANVYSKKVNALTLLAKQNSSVEFEPSLAPNGKVDATTTKYVVQRRKRPAVNVVATPNAGTTTSALAALDQLKGVEFDSVLIATGELKSVGFAETIADDFDFSNSPKHSRDMLYTVGEIATDREKKLIDLLKTATKTGAAIPAFVEGKAVVWSALAAESARLAKVDDEFLDVQHKTDFIHVISDDVATEIAKEMGQAFNQEAPIAQTGFMSEMSINGVPVIVSPRLTGRQAFTYHNEAIAFKKQPIEKDIKVDLGLVEYTGKFFFDVMAIIDTARVSQFGTTVK